MATIVANKIGKVVNLLIDGNVYQKSFEEKAQADEFFKLALEAKRGGERELNTLLTSLNRMYRAVVHGFLETENDQYFLKGFNEPIPEVLVNTFLEYIDNNFPTEALVNFWKLLMLNPDVKIRQTLFDFLQQYQFAITDNGYFIAYKVVKTLQNSMDAELVAYVQEKYKRVKLNKKSPKNYSVLRDTTKNTYIVMNSVLDDSVIPDLNENVKFVGNLSDLFDKIDAATDKVVYTDKHNGTTRIMLGEAVRKERQFEPHTVECSSNGLHVGSTPYVKWFYNQGETVLMVLVNPAHVIHVPSSESTKMRTAEYYPYAVLNVSKDEKGTHFDVLEQPYFETDYSAYEKEQVERDLDAIQQAENNGVRSAPNQLDYKKILESRLVDLNTILNQ